MFNPHHYRWLHRPKHHSGSLQAVKGKTKRFHIQLQRDARPTILNFTVNRVSNPDVNAAETTETTTATMVPATPMPQTATPPTMIGTNAKRVLFTSTVVDNPINETKRIRDKD